MTYSEKLKDPRWQKKRLEVMEAAGFACVECGATEKTLHVHHLIYKKNTQPWEYEDKELACLCETCHFIRHEVEKLLEHQINLLKLHPKFSSSGIKAFGYMQTLIGGFSTAKKAYKKIEYAEGISDGLHIQVSFLRNITDSTDEDTFLNIMSAVSKDKQ